MKYSYLNDDKAAEIQATARKEAEFQREREAITASSLEELRAQLNRLSAEGVPLSKIEWWGWDDESVQTRSSLPDYDGKFVFNNGRK